MVDELTRHEAHHDLGSAEQRHRPSRLKLRLGKEHGHHTHRTIPTGRADVDRDADVDPGPSPRLEVIGEEELSRRAHPDQHEDPTRAPLATFDEISYGPTQRSQADPARHHHDVGRIINGAESPVVPEGCAHADLRSDRSGTQRSGHRAHIAHGVLNGAFFCGCARNRHRHLPHTEGGQHVELSVGEVEGLAGLC